MKKINLLIIIALAILSSCNKIGLNEITVTEDITISTTWEKNKTYIIDGTLSVKGNQVLTIEPGTVIKFTQGSEISVGSGDFGTIKAIGTEKDPIIFTSNASVKNRGDWNGIYLYEGANGCEFEFCTFEFGGGYSEWDGVINMSEANVSFKNCTFTESGSYAIVAEESGFSAFENNLFSENTGNPINIDADFIHTIGVDNSFTGSGVLVDGEDIEISGEYTWRKLSVPYIFDNHTNIGSEQGAVIINIEPGTTIQMMSGAEIAVSLYSRYGAIVANGTADQMITFTSNSAYPDKGDWDGIWFYENTLAQTSFDYCVFSYAGGYNETGNLNLRNDCGSNISVSNSIISNSAGYGVYIDDEDFVKPTLINNTYSNNTFGDKNW